MPKVSFVIPTRNQAPFLRKCLDSCLAQGLPGAEVLVIDGLSDDGTQQILAGYGPAVRWVSERDAGQADAVNKGVRLATGEVIAWVNSDDYYAGDGVVGRVAALFDADPLLDIVYGDGLMVDAGGAPIRPWRSRELRSLKDLIVAPAGVALQPSVFFRKRLFDEVGGLATHLHWAMDYDLWLRIFPLARRYLRLPECLSCATYHPGAKSVNGLLPQVRELCALKRRHAASFGLGPADRLRMARGVASLYLYWLAVRLHLRRAV